MVSGEKEFLLFRPGEKPKLYYETLPEVRFDDASDKPSVRIDDLHGLVDLTDWDEERFPEYRNAHGLRCTVKQGDALFVPSHWHHTVHSRSNPASANGLNVGVNFWYSARLSEQDAISLFPMVTAARDEL